MPIYEYRCRECDRVFEISRSMADSPAHEEKCPSCGSVADRVYSGVYAKTSKKS